MTGFRFLGHADPQSPIRLALDIPLLFERFGIAVVSEIFGPTYVLSNEHVLCHFWTDREALQWAWRLAGGRAQQRRWRREGRPQSEF